MTFVNMYGGVRTEREERNENDHYPTPPLATYALLTHSPVPNRVWEPATGRGWMAWELERNGHQVTKTDLFSYDDPVVPLIHTPYDFLARSSLCPVSDGVVTNPPYGKDMAQKFIMKALEEYQYVAMLCRLTFAESIKRHAMFTGGDRPTDVYVFSGRFSCEEKTFLTHPLRGMICYAWWVWDRRDGPIDHTRMHWIDTPAVHKAWLQSLTIEQYRGMEAYIG